MEMEYPAESLKKTICYYYLLAFCPAEDVEALKKAAQPLREAVTKEAGLGILEYFTKAPDEISHHIMAFHQGTRQPDEDWVKALAGKMKAADSNPSKAQEYQQMMTLVARLPQRAQPRNRLHHRRGCQFCAAPCHYGYFSLVSEPDFEVLANILDDENAKLPDDKAPITAVNLFSLLHIHKALEIPSGSTLYIHYDHLANLSYCLLALGTAKSRLPFPEEQLRLFQETNQYIIQQDAPVGV